MQNFWLKPIKKKRMKKWLNPDKSQVFFWFLLLFLGIEALNKLYYHIIEAEFYLQKLVKLLAFAFMFTSLLFTRTQQLLGIFLLVLWFVLGQYFLPQAFTTMAIIGFSRYLFFLILLLYFKDLGSFDKHKTRKIASFWEFFLWVNNILIVLGALLQLEWFKSYEGERWGYNGLVWASANSTYLYLSALLYFVFYYKKKFYYQPLFWFTLVASLLIGTKSVYLAVFLFSLVLLVNAKISKKWVLGSLSLISMLFLVGVYVLFNYSLFAEISKEEGWLTAVLSYRDDLLLTETIPYIQENWRSLHYFIGGLSNPLLRPQLELIDLWLYFGILGAPLYLYLFFRYYFNFKLAHQDKLWFAVLLAVPLITGNFFYNASVPIYLLLIKLAYLKTPDKFSITADKP